VETRAKARDYIPRSLQQLGLFVRVVLNHVSFLNRSRVSTDGFTAFAPNVSDLRALTDSIAWKGFAHKVAGQAIPRLG
jgi:hypothetical protein